MTTCRSLVVVALCLTTLTGSVATAQETEAATRQFAAAVGFQNQKLYKDAIAEWTTFLRKFPGDARARKARHYLGTCCLQSEDYLAAVAAFTKVKEGDGPFDLMDQTLLNLGIAWYGQAQKSSRAADYRSAERAFDQMLSNYADSQFAPRAVYYQAECLFQRQEHSAAAASYARFVRQYPRHELHADALYGLGTALEADDDTAAAEKAFAQFTTQYASHPLATEVRMRQADLLFNAKNFASAEKVFARIAADRDFELADLALLRQARCLYEQGEMTAAARLYWNVPRSFRKTKYYDAAILAGAKCYYLEERYDLAKSGLERLIDRTGDEGEEAYLWLARCHLKEDNPQQALQIASRGLRRVRGDMRSELDLVRIDAMYEIPGSRAEATELYERFAERNADSSLAPQAQYMAALSALENEQYDKAGRLSEQFLSRRYNSELTPDVLFISAESQLLRGKHGKAVTRYEQFLKVGQKHANYEQATVRLALALLMDEQADRSVQILAATADQIQDRALKAEAFSILGRGYAAQDRFDQAARQLQQSLTLEKDPKRKEETTVALAEALRKAGREAEADTQLKNMLAGSGTGRFSAEASFRLAESAFAAEEYDSARRYYSRVIQQEPDGDFGPHALYGLGWTLFRTGEYQDCRRVMSKLIRDFARKESIAQKGYYVRGMAAYQLDEFADVVRDIDTYLQTQPQLNEELDALYVKGLALAGMEQPRQSAAVFESIIARGSEYESGDKVMYELGWTYRDLNQPDKAVATFTKLAQTWPDSEMAAESLFLVGEAWYDAEHFEKAAAAYTRSSQSPGNAEIAEKSLHKLGWSHLKAGQNAAAVDAFEKQLKTHPRGTLAVDARFLVGESQFLNEDWKSARAAFEAVATAGDSDYTAIAMFRAGECAASLGDWPASLAWHQKVLNQYPGFEMKPEARYGQGWALQNQGRYDEAVALYEQVTEETQTETAAKARFMIGECLFAQKQHKDASRHFLKAAFTYNHREWSAMAWFEAARCFEVLRDTEQAASCYRSLIEKFPQHARVPDAKRRLAEL